MPSLFSTRSRLAMQGIDIHKVKIRSAGHEVRDQFFIADRWGRKIEDNRDPERLRMAVAMIKQFTRFLPEAPDPAQAMRHFDQFLDKMAEEKPPDHIMPFLRTRLEQALTFEEKKTVLGPGSE